MSRQQIHWQQIPWKQVSQEVHQIQVEIMKAERAGHQRKVFALQDRLIRSQAARLLAVRQVTSNSGKNTPGVDGEIWRRSDQKEQAVRQLSNIKGYRPEPARRVYIPKENGKTRPLGILTMKDRAMQALYQQALDPIAETHADPHSYGFRKHRCTADAISYCAEIFAQKDGPKWVLEADIEECFDTISHSWLLRHILLDKYMLRAWLTAGYVEKGRFHHVRKGLPQGGIISPTLANMALDGMEEMLVTYFHHSPERRAQSQIAFVRYADDFIVAGASKKMLQYEVKPLLANFLKERGMRFSVRKTTLTHVSDGFDFLGYHLVVRAPVLGKYSVSITPARKSLGKLLATIAQVIKKHPEASAAQLIQMLNPIIRGWTRHYTFVESRESFLELDKEIYHLLRTWVKRRITHRWQWKQTQSYFCQVDKASPVFISEHGEQIYCARQTPATTYLPINARCNPYDPAWEAHLNKRR